MIFFLVGKKKIANNLLLKAKQVLLDHLEK
jgi:hypothetical protein